MPKTLAEMILLLGRNGALLEDEGEAPDPVHSPDDDAVKEGSEESAGILQDAIKL